MPSIPASPEVTMQYTTSFPCAVQRATAAAEPNSMSSGCATIASARLQSSGNGSSGGGMSMGSSMPRIRLAAQSRGRLAGHMADLEPEDAHA
jgi:hypothetical protein